MKKTNRYTRTPQERFFEKVHKTETCWIWTACKDGKGYGIFRLNKGPMTHCPRGHEYNEENTRHYRGRRFCKCCRKLNVWATQKQDPALL